MMSIYRNYSRGFSLVEAVFVVSILVVVIIGLLSASAAISRASLDNTARIQAHFLAEEGLEAMRTIRDDGWEDNIAPLIFGQEYYLHFNGSTWTATTTSSMVDEYFERTLFVDSVSRDASDKIVSSGGTIDPDTKKVSVSVSWSKRGATTTKSVSTYLTNLFDE